jgi:hypothetical protein
VSERERERERERAGFVSLSLQCEACIHEASVYLSISFYYDNCT